MSRADYGPDDFTRIQHLYNKAECFVKHVETHQSDISIPAINELRYAGHHLLKALTSDDGEVFKRELRKTESHCQRAIYEASESGILYFLGLVNEFAGDFKDVSITQVIPDYVSILSLAKKAREQLSAGRLNRDSAEKQAADYMTTFHQLAEKIELLDVSRGELNKIKMRQVTADRRFLIVAVISAASLIASLIIVLHSLGIPSEFRPEAPESFAIPPVPHTAAVSYPSA